MDDKIVFSSSIEAEMQESCNWYEEKQLGLGERFIDVIENSIFAISQYPEAFPIRANSFREYVVPKFPYILVYEIVKDKNLIYVLHIFNTYLKPEKKQRNKI